MVRDLSLPLRAKGLRRVEGKTLSVNSILESFVTGRTKNVFTFLLKNGAEAVETFLSKDSTNWSLNSCSCIGKGLHRGLHVVYDCAKRSIGLVQAFDLSITKNKKNRTNIFSGQLT